MRHQRDHPPRPWTASEKPISLLYDSSPGLQIIFSGSSILQLHEQDVDLSRRVVLYSLHCLSFREFLLFECGLCLPILGLKDLLQDHLVIGIVQLLETIGLPSVLARYVQRLFRIDQPCLVKFNNARRR